MVNSKPRVTQTAEFSKSQNKPDSQEQEEMLLGERGRSGEGEEQKLRKGMNVNDENAFSTYSNIPDSEVCDLKPFCFQAFQQGILSVYLQQGILSVHLQQVTEEGQPRS